MSIGSHAYERCRAFIDSNFVEAQPEQPRKPLALAISRQAFSGSHEIAEKLLIRLNADPRLGQQPWALFDRDLVHRILEDHHLPKRLAKYMPEDRDREFTSTINEILGLHPSSWKLFHYTCDTIHKLASIGNVILIGRGSHIVTRGMPHVLRVRLIAPFEQRVQTASQRLSISIHEAAKEVRQDDQSRAAFVRSHFNESLDDPQTFDLVMNTRHLGTTTAAEILFSALKQHELTNLTTAR